MHNTGPCSQQQQFNRNAWYVERRCATVSKLNVKQQWWKHACHSSPSCLRPSAASRQASFISFLPSCNKHSHNTTNPQKTAIHPTLPGKKRPVSSQPVKGPEHRVRLHPSAECRCSSYALPCISSRAHTYRQMDQAPAFVCRLQIHRLDSHVSLPSSLPRSPCPPRYERHRAPTSRQQRQPAAAAAAGSAPLRLLVKGCHGGAQAIAATLWSTEIVLFLPDLCLPQTGFNWFRSSHIKPRNAAWPQKHTGRGDDLTAREHCHVFHGGKCIVCRFCEGFQEAHRVKRLISEQEEEAKGVNSINKTGICKAIQRDHSSPDLHLVRQNTQMEGKKNNAEELTWL